MLSTLHAVAYSVLTPALRHHECCVCVQMGILMHTGAKVGIEPRSDLLQFPALLYPLHYPVGFVAVKLRVPFCRMVLWAWPQTWHAKLLATAWPNPKTSGEELWGL